MSEWISAAKAFEIVLSHEMDPDAAKRAIMQAVAEGSLPGRAVDRSSAEERYLSKFAHCFSGSGISCARIDFNDGTAVISTPGLAFMADHSAPFEHTYLDSVVFSRKHLLVLWPEEATGGRPKGSGLERADAPVIERMAALVDSGLSPTAAAKQIVGDGSGAPGAGTPESKVSRLVRRFKNGE